MGPCKCCRKALHVMVICTRAGNGSNIASANESNNDHSEGPSATQENSGLSTGGADLDLQFSADPMSLEAPEVNASSIWGYCAGCTVIHTLFPCRALTAILEQKRDADLFSLCRLRHAHAKRARRQTMGSSIPL